MIRSRPGLRKNSTTLPIWVCCATAAPGTMSASTRVLLVEADPALTELLEEWLADQGCRVVQERPDLVLVDLPFPRERGLARLRQLGYAHPNIPVVAMPKPLVRDAFIAALRRALNEIH